MADRRGSAGSRSPAARASPAKPGGGDRGSDDILDRALAYGQKEIIGNTRAGFAIQARAGGLKDKEDIDAHRHISASALTTGRASARTTGNVGKAIAKALGDLGEFFGSNDETDKTMDKRNNAIGRELAAQLGDKAADPSAVDRAVREKIGRGEHWTREKVKAEQALPEHQRNLRELMRDRFDDHDYHAPGRWDGPDALPPDRPGPGERETYHA